MPPLPQGEARPHRGGRAPSPTAKPKHAKREPRLGFPQRVKKVRSQERPPLGGGWHGVSRGWGRESKSFVYLRYAVIIATFSLPQSASLTAPSSEGALGATAPKVFNKLKSPAHDEPGFVDCERKLAPSGRGLDARRADWGRELKDFKKPTNYPNS